MKQNKLPACCKPQKGIKAGILSGIIPHAGCILIIVLALIGVTAANSFFIKFLSYKYYIPLLFVISLFIASIAAFFYIRRFSDKRIKSHWKYLTILYVSVITINLIMIYLIFPYTSGLASSENTDGKLLNLSFEIPCSGHASLVISELQAVEGIKSVKYISGNDFEIYYNPEEISEEEILIQNICKEFKAEKN